MNAVVVDDYLDAVIRANGITALEGLEQVPEQLMVLAGGRTRMHDTGAHVPTTRPVVFLVLAGRHDFHWRAPWHPLITGLRQPMDIEFISKQQRLAESAVFPKSNGSEPVFGCARHPCLGPPVWLVSSASPSPAAHRPPPHRPRSGNTTAKPRFRWGNDAGPTTKQWAGAATDTIDVSAGSAPADGLVQQY